MRSEKKNIKTDFVSGGVGSRDNFRFDKDISVVLSLSEVPCG